MHAARAAGFTVREAALQERDAKARSGWALLKGSPVIFVDPKLSTSERLELFASALRHADLENLYLSPAARHVIEDHSRKEP